MKATALVLLVVLVILLAPLLAIWGVNTISEQASMGWYIPHNVWTYLSIYALSAVFKGAK
jgi:hypothetical protein